MLGSLAHVKDSLKWGPAVNSNFCLQNDDVSDDYCIIYMYGFWYKVVSFDLNSAHEDVCITPTTALHAIE